MLPEAAQSGTGILVLYDLRDPDAWQAAHDASEAWGREWTQTHHFGVDHVLIDFRPGGASSSMEAAS